LLLLHIVYIHILLLNVSLIHPHSWISHNRLLLH
jgi:hypothetical protein